MTGLVFNIQRFSLHDGPGIRTTVFLKGCPLNCKWCSNPESIGIRPEIMTFDMRCIGCGKCSDICPQEAIKIVDNSIAIDRNKCNSCLECARVCPSGAIEQIGRYLTVEEAVTEIEKDIMFYVNSGGGVTLSGGEPLNQWAFAREVFKQCKAKGIHTTLDTTGYARWDIMQAVLDYTDLVLYDIKHPEGSRHKEGTGVSNELILGNLFRTSAGVKTWLRVPLIPTFNDSESCLKRISDLAIEAKVEKVSLLPCHEWGVPKYARLGKTYPFDGFHPFSEERIQEFKSLVQSYGLEVNVGR